MVIRVSIPSFRKVKDEDDAYTVFLVDIWVSGHHHVIEKRYSEFEELHKQLKKIMETPEFPPKKVLKWNPKVLEHRRVGLDAYVQGIIENEPIPHDFLAFLEADLPSGTLEKYEEERVDVNTLIEAPKGLMTPVPLSCFKTQRDILKQNFDKHEDDVKLSHQPLVIFESNAFLKLQESKAGSLPNIVSEGVTMSLYGSDIFNR